MKCIQLPKNGIRGWAQNRRRDNRVSIGMAKITPPRGLIVSPSGDPRSTPGQDIKRSFQGFHPFFIIHPCEISRKIATFLAGIIEKRCQGEL